MLVVTLPLLTIFIGIATVGGLSSLYPITAGVKLIVPLDTPIASAITPDPGVGSVLIVRL